MSNSQITATAGVCKAVLYHHCAHVDWLITVVTRFTFKNWSFSRRACFRFRKNERKIRGCAHMRFNDRSFKLKAHLKKSRHKQQVNQRMVGNKTDKQRAQGSSLLVRDVMLPR